MKKTNTADLHLQYKMETGEWFQWDNSKHNHHQLHGTGGYTREYAEWLEEKFLELLNEKVENIGLLEHVESELENVTEYVNSLEEEIEDLKDEIEGLHEANAGPDL